MRTQKKRAFSLFTGMVLVAAMLAGCSSGAPEGASAQESVSAGAESSLAGSAAPADDGDSEPVHLVFWGGVPPENGYMQLCENFGEEFKDQNITIEYERFVNDETGNMKLETTLMAGSDIDVYMTYSRSNLVKRRDGNMAEDLTPYMERDGYSLVENYGEFAETTYIDGRTYALPTTLTQNNLLINKDMFDAAGIPIPKSWTLGEFREIAKQLTHGEGEEKVYGMFWNTAAIKVDPAVPVTLALGGDWMFKEGGTETNFDHPYFEEALGMATAMMHEDLSCPTHVDSITQKLTIEGMFLSGKTAITVGSWAIRNVKNLTEYPHDFVTAAAPFPTIEGQANYSNGVFGDLLVMNAKSEHKEEAWTFMKWYAEKGMLPVVAGGRTPSNVNFNIDDVTSEFISGSEAILDADSIRDVMIAPKEKYPVQNILTKLPEISKIFEEELEAIYIGEKTVAEAMASAKTRGDEQLQ